MQGTSYTINEVLWRLDYQIDTVKGIAKKLQWPYDSTLLIMITMMKAGLIHMADTHCDEIKYGVTMKARNLAKNKKLLKHMHLIE